MIDWEKGKHTDGSVTFEIKIGIAESSEGHIASYHDFLSEEDLSLAEGLSSKGNVQIAHALLLEAIKRELYIEATQLAQQNSLGDISVEKLIVDRTIDVITKITNKVTGSLAQGTLQQLRIR